MQISDDCLTIPSQAHSLRVRPLVPPRTSRFPRLQHTWKSNHPSSPLSRIWKPKLKSFLVKGSPVSPKTRPRPLQMPLEKCTSCFPKLFSLFSPPPSARAPDADLPTTASFLGGLIGQEAIKMITRQYIPTNGFCAIDLVASVTAELPIPSS